MNRERARELSREAVGLGLGLFAFTVTFTVAGSNLSWAVAAAGLLGIAWTGGKIPFDARHSPIEMPLYLFLTAALVTSLLGVDTGHSLRSLNQDAHKVWLYLLFMTALSVRKPERTHWFLAAGFAFAAVTGIGQAVLPMFTHPPSEWRYFRAHAFVHPVTFGEQMAVAVLGGAAFLMRGAGDRRERAWTAAFLALTAPALFLSGTRGALVSCVFGLTLTLLFEPRLRRLFVILLPLGALAFLGMELEHFSRSLLAYPLSVAFPGLGLTVEPPRDNMLRLDLWKAALRIGLDHPWTGIGCNNFRAILPQYLDRVFEDGTKSWGSAHNLYLHHFAERGLLGLAALLVLLAAFWRRALERARRAPDAWNLWAFSTASAFLVMNLTEVALQVELFWMLVLFIWIQSEVRSRA